MKKEDLKKAGTFELNKIEPIHNWYSYVEGYSACLVINELDMIKDKKIECIYDPFAGTGTTPLVASQRGIKSYYSETNPFMLNVIDTKINCVRKICNEKIGTTLLKEFLDKIEKKNFKSIKNIEWGGFEKFFEEERLNIILQIKKEIFKVKEENTRKILMLALSSIVVPSSKTVRRGDLRYATEKEMIKKNKDSVIDLFIKKLESIINDIGYYGNTLKCETTLLKPDARDISEENLFDCVITSPPYLNGTNYIRNTKLELKLNDFITDESNMPFFHSKGIIAGINNVSKRNENFIPLDFVKPYVDRLEPIVYDKRIVKMIIGYFNDMDTVIKKLSVALKDNGIFIMDIGDSQFAGVHIPTHEILSQICENYGFIKYDESILRKRRSKNKMVLSQRILRFKLEKNKLVDEHNKEAQKFLKKATDFIKIMPYKNKPYVGRNWGHPWHSLCSYHGKLKPAIAYFLIKDFTEEGDIVLDPLSGVGTIPFEACLQGRIGIGNDLSEMAFVVSKAKLEKPDYEEVKIALDKLDKYILKNKDTKKIAQKILENKDFGYNKTLAAYFHEDTFREIICAREYFLTNIHNITSSDAVILSAFMHVLHGNRPYALSRISHSLTPYAPKGEFVYKNVIKHIKDKIDAAYKTGDFSNYVKGRAIYGDYSNIVSYNLEVDYIICSPPFADSIKFYMQNWMRLWLCGWDKKHFKDAEQLFLDSKQKKDFSVYDSFFKMCSKVLKKDGKVILHLGKTSKIDMACELEKYASKYFDIVYIGKENVSNIEKHGIKDKGNTVEHEFMFLIKK